MVSFQFETFEDRKIAFGDAEQHYEQKLPYKPSPWAQRLDVVQRIQTHTMLEADRREKEAEATKQKLQKYEDEHIKSGGQPLKLLETQDFVRNIVLFFSICVLHSLQKDPEDPDFFQPGAHESKIEEMFEMAYVMIVITRGV